MKVKIRGDLSKIELFPDDVFLASYPRSGNSWMRLLLSSYVIGSRDTIHSFEQSCRVVAEIYESSVEALSRMARPRLIKTHSAFDPKLPRVIYIARDARDVAVSYYYYHRKFVKKEIPFSDFLRKFNLGQLDEFGIWSDHVNSWLDGGGESPDFLVVKYEDLKRDAAEQLENVVKFIWGSVNSERVSQAVEAAELSNLQAGEKRFDWFPGSDDNVRFFRSGNVGDWESHFSEVDLETFVKLHGSALTRLGYVPADKLQPGDRMSSSKGLAVEASNAYRTQYVNASLWENQHQIQERLQDIQEQLHQARLQLNQVQDQLHIAHETSTILRQELIVSR
ncbi:MAG: sulfotransferase domain-containing protein, partial [Cyanobacteria bacterium P01_A01_bin.135]